MGDLLLPFLLTALAVELTPGPNMAWLALLAAQRGRGAGLAAVAGVASGLLLLGAVAGVGLGSLVTSQPIVYEIVRWAGVAFLVYLAWDTWQDARRPLDLSDGASGAAAQFRRALIANLLNPKAALFFAVVLPGYLPNGAGLGTAATFTLLYVGVATFVHLGVVLLSSLLQPFLTGSRYRQVLGGFFAVLLIAVALWLAWSTRR